MEEIILRLRRTNSEIPGAIKVKIRNKLSKAHLISPGKDHKEPVPERNPSKEMVKSVNNKQ
jgi:hypothetical protein